MKVSIIVFEINEIAGLKEMMPQIKKEWYDELIIVDGGSTDGSIEFAGQQGYSLFIQKEKGVGAALNEAVRKVSGDIVVIFAPDGSFLADRIPLMVQKIKEGFDIVNVSRYCKGARSLDDNMFTGVGNRLFTSFANLLYGARLTDLLYTYLGFRRDVVDKLQLDTNSWTWGQMLLLRGIRRKLKIVEIPGDEPPRIGGAIKMPKFKAGLLILEKMLQERFR